MVAMVIRVPVKKISTVLTQTQKRRPRTPADPGSLTRARLRNVGSGSWPRTWWPRILLGQGRMTSSPTAAQWGSRYRRRRNCPVTGWGSGHPLDGPLPRLRLLFVAGLDLTLLARGRLGPVQHLPDGVDGLSAVDQHAPEDQARTDTE